VREGKLIVVSPAKDDDELLDELFTIGNLTDEQFRQVKRLRAENERLRAERPLSDEELKYGQELIRHQPPDWVLPRLAARAHRAEAENERLRAVVDAARAFVTWHQRGQPGAPDTLYPMTYGALDQWHTEWDRSLEILANALKDI
jgi:hypothetical protein